MNETQKKAAGVIGLDAIKALHAAGLEVVPVVLPPLAVARVKDLMAQDYSLYSIEARPLWAELLKRVSGLSIEAQQQLHDTLPGRNAG